MLELLGNTLYAEFPEPLMTLGGSLLTQSRLVFGGE